MHCLSVLWPDIAHAQDVVRIIPPQLCSNMPVKCGNNNTTDRSAVIAVITWIARVCTCFPCPVRRDGQNLPRAESSWCQGVCLRIFRGKSWAGMNDHRSCRMCRFAVALHQRISKKGRNARRILKPKPLGPFEQTSPPKQTRGAFIRG